ncbi:MAG: hypothetical protein JRN12_08015 [Nitrososphaerota archaeon]|nr:hypothetical protein [Nitrososphaerota archaeon]
MNTKKSLALSILSAFTALTILGASAPAFAATPASINGYWVITQAASASQGAAPTIVACGTFSLSATPLTSNTFDGKLSFSTGYSIPTFSLTLPGAGSPETVIGSTMTLPVGALFVSLKGAAPVALSASLTSPSSTPHPSINPTSVGCAGFSQPEFLGLVHLPMQGTEGMTIYGPTSGIALS